VSEECCATRKHDSWWHKRFCDICMTMFSG
jgi:hypothetical protein